MKSITLIHGLPDHSGSWEKVIPILSGDFDKIQLVGLPGLVDKAELAPNSTLESLANALTEKMDGDAKAILVGHDFGAILASLISQSMPELHKKLVLINGPSPDVLLHAIKNDPVQNARSQYAYAIVRSPEIVLAEKNYAFLKSYLFRDENSPSQTYKESLVKTWSDPLVRKNIGIYYQAFLNHQGTSTSIETKTLQIWSNEDPFFSPKVRSKMAELYPKHEVEEVETGSHWPQLSAPEKIAKLITSFANSK